LDPMRHNIIHTLLVTSNRLQAIPAVGVGLILLGLAGLVYVAGGSVVVYLVVAFANWFVLWMLPRAGRSFGPDRPSTLALAVVTALLLSGLGLIGAPVWLAILTVLTLFLLVVYSTWIEPFRLGVSYEQLQVPGVSSLRILHIGDMHLERITFRERLLNRLVAELQPDAILFSGDFVNISYSDDPTTADQIRQIIGEWSAPMGVYCVPGTYTVESIEQVRGFVDGLDNLRLLEDEWVQVGDMHIFGMVTTHRMAEDQSKLRQLTASREGPKVLLTHAPDVAPVADELGYNLYLCGHTHGGQIRFPLIGAVFSGSALGMQFVMGRYDLDNVTVYTSRGVGLEGMGAPRARFLCPPEIILWQING
jgi:uncharacterized protein